MAFISPARALAWKFFFESNSLPSEKNRKQQAGKKGEGSPLNLQNECFGRSIATRYCGEPTRKTFGRTNGSNSVADLRPTPQKSCVTHSNPAILAQSDI